MHKIVENNKLIAKFMGLEIITDGISWFDTNYKPLKKYHSSWNALMPVIEKIEMTTIYYITTDYDRRDDFKGWSVHLFTLWPKDEIICYIEDKTFETKIEAAYYGCVEYIKWHNKKQKL